MPKKKPQTINQLLNQPQGNVRALMDKLTKIRTINSNLHLYINPILSQHCRVVNIRKSTLVLAVDNAIWANKLRFELPNLLSFFRNNGFISLANIEVIVQPQ